MRIERVTAAAEVHRAADLFDAPPLPVATERFLAEPGHHLLLAYDDAGRPVGMVSGVETIHPDKGAEMLLYELGVAPAARLQGIGKALVAALAELARARGCYGMWVATETDNAAGLATYRAAGASEETVFTMLSWDLSGEEEAHRSAHAGAAERPGRSEAGQT